MQDYYLYALQNITLHLNFVQLYLSKSISMINTSWYNLDNMDKIPEYSDKNITRSLIIFLIIFSFVLFFLAYVCLPLKEFNILTDSFNKIAVGLSALAAVIFGPTLVSRELEKDRKIKEYLKRYPHEKFGKEWEIIESERHPGAIYLFDKKTKTKHHILNMKTVYDLGWHIYPRITIQDSKFQSFNVGDRIRTQGEAGE